MTTPTARPIAPAALLPWACCVLVVGWFAAGRLGCAGGYAVLDGRPLTAPVLLEDANDAL